MQIFYVPDLIRDNNCLNEAESHHAIKVMRLQNGDKINLVDGKGTFYKAIISDAHPKHTQIEIEETLPAFEKRPYELHIAISPLKNTDRFEWFLEKATEIGIDRITPIICKRTEKKGFNAERAHRIVESAMKQSLKAYCPVIDAPIPFTEFMKQENNDVKLIAYCEGERKPINEVYTPTQNTTILIGPEGDFTEEEVETGKHKGYIPITLGNSRLRTETAGIVACHSVFYINNFVG
ncbi:MAG TPA: 16S rRNA (uracil(1498)-N(3))-methyltransferase [Bacteroidales bacterium]|nr:16S rRNA (uracil(1498)-N(3))-methyltransferase [Bacteroidales bacterium]